MVSGTEIICAPTGIDTHTGGRIKRIAEYLLDDTFHVTYADVMHYLQEDSVLEREPLEQLVADRQLRAFHHEGFWKCMDAYKDALVLRDLWNEGVPRWTHVGATTG